MISIAWGIPVNRVLGGPGWTTVDRYDLDATMNEQSTPQEANAMLRTLLNVDSGWSRGSRSATCRSIS